MPQPILFAFLGFLAGLMAGIVFAAWRYQQKVNSQKITWESTRQQDQSAWENRLQAEVQATQRLLTDQHTQQQQQLQNQLTLSQNQLLDLATQEARVSTELETVRREHEAWKTQLETQWEQHLNRFLAQSLETLNQKHTQQAQTTWAERQAEFVKTMEETVNPLHLMVKNYREELEKQLADNTRRTIEITSSLQQRMNDLIWNTGRLANALSTNKGRGDWGELSLKLLLEDAGLKEGLHFETQLSIGDDRSRPDVQVKLPDGRCMFIDAKALQLLQGESSQRPDLDAEGFPLYAPTVLEQESTETQEQRQKRSAKSLREAMKTLISREYQSKLTGSADFVVLYLPKESMLSDALEADRSLFEEAYRNKIFLAGPLNLVAMLKMVTHSWQQAQLSEDAHKILEMGQTLYARVASYIERFEKVGSSLDSSVKAYNAAQTAFFGGQGFIKQLQKMEDYGVKQKTSKTLPDQPRMLDLHPEPLPALAGSFMSES